MPANIVADVAESIGRDASEVSAVIDEFALQLHKRALEYRGLNGDLIGEDLWHQVGPQAFYHLLGSSSTSELDIYGTAVAPMNTLLFVVALGSKGPLARNGRPR